MSKVSRHWEKNNSLYFAIVITILVIIFHDKINNFEIECDNLNNIGRVFVTLLGFFMTILSIIRSIDNRAMKFIKDAGAYNILLSYIFIAIRLQFITLFATFIYPFCNNYMFIKQYILIFLISWCSFASFNFASLFMKIIKSGSNKEKDEIED